jgi:hypothetical protein
VEESSKEKEQKKKRKYIMKGRKNKEVVTKEALTRKKN